jgi:outer membrane lipoprotein SlyB
MCRLIRTGALVGMAAFLAAVSMTGCSPSYSPNSYASNAAQLANKVDQGIVVGVRAVQISADATLGTGTGGAAGGIAGSQVGGGVAGAFGALTGSVVGGAVGNVVTHAAGDTTGFEYIVRKTTNGDKNNGDLMSVTQKDMTPLDIGAHVLIIEGPQARIVADYTVPVVVQPLHPEPAKPAVAEASPKPAEPVPAAAATPAPAPTPSPPPAATAAQSETASQPVATPLPPPATEPAKPAAPTDSVTPPAVKTEDASASKPSGS